MFSHWRTTPGPRSRCVTPRSPRPLLPYPRGMPVADAARTSSRPAPSTAGLDVLDVTSAQHRHAAGIVELRDTLARWMQARGIDQWREGEFTAAQVEQEIERGEWWVMDSPGHPERVLASVRVIWEDPMIWGQQSEPAGYIHGVAVDRRLRGTKTGPRLVRAAEDVIAASGRSVSRLDCDKSSPVLEPFYAGLGYTPRGEVDFDVPGMDYRVRLIRMERTLPPRDDTGSTANG